MRRHDAIYGWLISEITRLSDSPTADQYAANLPGEAIDRFASITEELRGVGVELLAAKADRRHCDVWPRLDVLINDFEASFGGFPGLACRKLQLIILLGNEIAEQAIPLDEDDILPDLFEIHALRREFPARWFARENTKSFENSLVVFCANDFEKLKEEKAAISPKLAFHLLATLAISDIPDRHAAFVKREDQPIAPEAIEAFARLVMVADGKPIHVPRSYGGAPAVLDKDCFRVGVPYQQLNEIFNVLSEYNTRTDLLTKFLTIYHVIENFMYRSPIVALERQNDGRMFSIRDFQRLYEEVDEREIAALKRLMKTVLSINASPTSTHQSLIKHRWRTWISSLSNSERGEIDAILNLIGLKRNSRPLNAREFDSGDFNAQLSQMIYSIRNSVVHNKETEFHLSHESLTEPMARLIEVFLLPSLEELCFGLIGVQNDVVWYSNPTISLYKAS